jgi:hypothetical protein
MIIYSIEKPIEFSVYAPYYEPYYLAAGTYSIDLTAANLSGDVKVYQEILTVGRLFPIRLVGWVMSGDYQLANWMQHTISTGKVVVRRDTVVSIERNAWTVITGGYTKKIVETLNVGDVKAGITFIKNWIPSNPRLRVTYTPAYPTGQGSDGLIEIFYELPVRNARFLLPNHAGRDYSGFAEDSPFQFVVNPELSEDEFLHSIVEFLSYDLDFYEADGSRANWWIDFLQRLQSSKNLSYLDREGVGSKPFR